MCACVRACVDGLRASARMRASVSLSLCVRVYMFVFVHVCASVCASMCLRVSVDRLSGCAYSHRHMIVPVSTVCTTHVCRNTLWVYSYRKAWKAGKPIICHWIECWEQPLGIVRVIHHAGKVFGRKATCVLVTRLETMPPALLLWIVCRHSSDARLRRRKRRELWAAKIFRHSGNFLNTKLTYVRAS